MPSSSSHDADRGSGTATSLVGVKREREGLVGLVERVAAHGHRDRERRSAGRARGERQRARACRVVRARRGGDRRRRIADRLGGRRGRAVLRGERDREGRGRRAGIALDDAAGRGRARPVVVQDDRAPARVGERRRPDHDLSTRERLVGLVLQVAQDRHRDRSGGDAGREGQRAALRREVGARLRGPGDRRVRHGHGHGGRRLEPHLEGRDGGARVALAHDRIADRERGRRPRDRPRLEAAQVVAGGEVHVIARGAEVLGIRRRRSARDLAHQARPGRRPVALPQLDPGGGRVAGEVDPSAGGREAGAAEAGHEPRAGTRPYVAHEERPCGRPVRPPGPRPVAPVIAV